VATRGSVWITVTAPKRIKKLSFGVISVENHSAAGYGFGYSRNFWLVSAAFIAEFFKLVGT
jgi:hypothetical protein